MFFSIFDVGYWWFGVIIPSPLCPLSLRQGFGGQGGRGEIMGPYPCVFSPSVWRGMGPHPPGLLLPEEKKE
jgi:hypothetical protein